MTEGLPEDFIEWHCNAPWRPKHKCMGSQSQKIGAYNYQEYITINDIFIENDAQVNVDPESGKEYDNVDQDNTTSTRYNLWPRPVRLKEQVNLLQTEQQSANLDHPKPHAHIMMRQRVSSQESINLEFEKTRQ